MSVYVVTLKGRIVGIYDNAYDAFHVKGDRIEKVIINKNY